MRPVLVFDVLETLLDVAALDEPFARGFGATAPRQEWFERTVRGALTAAVLHRWTPFDALAASALRAIEAAHAVSLDDMTRHRILAGLDELPPFGDVAPALTRLREAGYAVHALSNGTQRGTERALAHAGLIRFFDGVQSAELSETYKPAAQLYRNALARIGVAPHGALLVSAHAWEIAGAHAFGLPAAFVERGADALDPQAPPPQLVVRDLAALADRLIFFPLTALGARA